MGHVYTSIMYSVVRLTGMSPAPIHVCEWCIDMRCMAVADWRTHNRVGGADPICNQL